MKEDVSDVAIEQDRVDPIQSRRSLIVLLASMALAFIGPKLFVVYELGLGFSVFVLMALASLIGLRIYFRDTIHQSEKVLFGLMGVMSLTFVLRASDSLYGFSFLGICIIVCLSFTYKYARNYRSIAFTSWLLTPLMLIQFIVLSPFRLVCSGDIMSRLKMGPSSQIKAVIMGALWALPLLFVFGSLLVSSDQRFDQFTQKLFSFDLDQFLETLLLPVLYWPLMTALLISTVAHKTLKAPLVGQCLRMNGIQLNVMLFSLNGLFLTYLAIQASYFFGGSQLVTETSGLTYAVYARSGFWELVWVAIIAIPLMLLGHWVQRDEPAQVQKWFNGLASVLVLAIVVLEVSAAHRMMLYIQAYGLTELRFYASAFMVFVIIALLGFYLVVLRGSRDAYVSTVSSAAIGMILLVNILNPSALIAEHNLTRASLSKTDIYYLRGLGADAYPAIIAFKMLHPSNSDCDLKGAMRSKIRLASSWTLWNYSQAKALKAVNHWSVCSGEGASPAEGRHRKTPRYQG